MEAETLFTEISKAVRDRFPSGADVVIDAYEEEAVRYLQAQGVTGITFDGNGNAFLGLGNGEQKLLRPTTVDMEEPLPFAQAGIGPAAAAGKSAVPVMRQVIPPSQAEPIKGGQAG